MSRILRSFIIIGLVLIAAYVIRQSFFSSEPKFALDSEDRQWLEDQPADTSEYIIADAIEAHGGKSYLSLDVSFRFRDKEYSIQRSGGEFTYSRSFTDSLGSVTDELSNEGFTRFRDKNRVALTKKDSIDYSNSLNSVIYFALLPFGLQDDAVNSEYLGLDSIGGKEYNTIKVWFDQQGGGTDHEDVFMYWFDRDDSSMDYLAYEFHVNDGGTRFRKAIGSKRVDGVVFQDYENYKGPEGIEELSRFPELYQQGDLEKVSDIVLEDFRTSQYATRN